MVAATKERNKTWRKFIEAWKLPSDVNPRVACLSNGSENPTLPHFLCGNSIGKIAIEQTEGFSFAQLRETYILGSESAFEPGREITFGDVVEAIELQAAGAYDLKTSIAAPGFVRQPEAATR